MIRVEHGDVVISPLSTWFAFADAIDEKGAFERYQSTEIGEDRVPSSGIVGGVSFRCDWDELLAYEMEQLEALDSDDADEREVAHWSRQ